MKENINNKTEALLLTNHLFVKNDPKNIAKVRIASSNLKSINVFKYKIIEYSKSMSHPDNFQDWSTVILKNKSAEIKKRNVITEVQKRNTGNSLPKDVEAPQPVVTSDLRQKIINARVALKLNQDKLATSINVKPQDVKMLESGKMTMKDAKQIALKIERKYRVRILENN